MTIHLHDRARDGKIRCHSCWIKDPGVYITLWRAQEEDGLYDESFEAQLCPNCALNIGVNLICDSQEAMGSNIDPSLVTRRLTSVPDPEDDPVFS